MTIIQPVSAAAVCLAGHHNPAPDHTLRSPGRVSNALFKGVNGEGIVLTLVGRERCSGQEVMVLEE